MRNVSGAILGSSKLLCVISIFVPLTFVFSRQRDFNWAPTRPASRKENKYHLKLSLKYTQHQLGEGLDGPPSFSPTSTSNPTATPETHLKIAATLLAVGCRCIPVALSPRCSLSPAHHARRSFSPAHQAGRSSPASARHSPSCHSPPGPSPTTPAVGDPPCGLLSAG